MAAAPFVGNNFWENQAEVDSLEKRTSLWELQIALIRLPN
jgi:hypothetical protein